MANTGENPIKKKVTNIYKVINNRGKGELVELMREAQKSGKYTHVDDYIRDVFPTFLFKNGDGEKVRFRILIY